MRENFLIDQYTKIQQRVANISCCLRESIKKSLDYRGLSSCIDRIDFRVKSLDSFIEKSEREVDGIRKYPYPLEDIQDIIGGRVVVLRRGNVLATSEILKREFHWIEQTQKIPDDINSFGYEGDHYIMHIPPHIFERTNPGQEEEPVKFFELQVKTLYQHAWAQTTHSLGYKCSSKIGREEKRLLAFLAAQSWGADHILEELRFLEESRDLPLSIHRYRSPEN